MRPLQVSSGNGLPTTAAVNGVKCTVTVAPPPPPPPPSSGAIESAGQLTTSNGQIIGLDGNPLYLIGINYFGFDDGNTMVDGLWIGEGASLPSYDGQPVAPMSHSTSESNSN